MESVDIDTSVTNRPAIKPAVPSTAAIKDPTAKVENHLYRLSCGAGISSSSSVHRSRVFHKGLLTSA